MTTFRRALLCTVVGTLALASQSANANLVIVANGTTEATSADNTLAAFSGALGSFNINNLVAVGQGSFGGGLELLDVGSLNVSRNGTGTLTLQIIETGLTGISASALESLFSGNIINASVTRSLSASTDNGATFSTVLGTTTLTGGSFVTDIPSGVDAILETITILANGVGSTLASEDTVSQVPEPALLSMMALGLTAVAFARRRK